jgi:polysaccharide export outer membrane protein
LPEFAVGPSGTINVPFAGNIPAAGRTLQQIEREIVSRLTGRANRPQALVRLVRNATATVTVVGDVTSSTRMPLTPRGERILDALAAAGGTRQPVDKITIQMTRGQQTYRMALQDVIDDPRNNVTLRVDDVVTALYRPFSFTVLGATGRNDEIPFEGTGISFAQALGRVGGLQDGRAAAKGVFIFRWEDPATPGVNSSQGRGPDGTVPVIYRFDLRDPAALFAVQSFRMRDHDIVYVANSPIAEFQRFVGLIASTVLPAAAVENSISNN